MMIKFFLVSLLGLMLGGCVTQHEKVLCQLAVSDGKWKTHKYAQYHVNQAKMHGYDCGVEENVVSNENYNRTSERDLNDALETINSNLMSGLIKRQQTQTPSPIPEISTVDNLRQHIASCWSPPAEAPGSPDLIVDLHVSLAKNGDVVDAKATDTKRYISDVSFRAAVKSAAKAVTDCSPLPLPPDKYETWKEFIFVFDPSYLASLNVPKAALNELNAARAKVEDLEQKLLGIEIDKETRPKLSEDKQKPNINIAGTSMSGPKGIIKGFVSDNTGIAELRVDGRLVEVDSYGNFMASTYVPEGGVSVSIEAIDLVGLSSSLSVRLDRIARNAGAVIDFERLNPLGRGVAVNKDALALIIGVDGYENIPARAIYADTDARVFTDYAAEKLGIPSNRIKTLVNDGADEKGMLLAVKDWLARVTRKNKTDIYVFFAGHGLSSQDGQKMYLLPYDGSPRLLDDTAILRDRLFSDIAASNPKSVTVFLDTCYSGATRGEEMLIAGRPITIRSLEKQIPDNFTLLTAAAGDQIANPLEEAKHGMFSYFLMKGMEGGADANNDNEITAGELHSYVQANVIQQSSGSQTPELQGDADRVLVRFQ